MRPPGYEPGELPTAPLRDVNITPVFQMRVQRYYYFLNPANILQENHYFLVFLLLLLPKNLAISEVFPNFAHC